MKKAILWRNTENTSLEYSTLQSSGDGFLLEGTVVMLLERLPGIVAYRVMCDNGWCTRHVEAAVESAGRKSRARRQAA
jgi:hypothetical protein